MVSDIELADKIHEFLRGSDLKNTNNNIVRKKLESDFGVDLSDKKIFLREQIDRFLQSQYNVSEDEGDEFEGEADINDDLCDSEDDLCDDGGQDVGVNDIHRNSNGVCSLKGVTVNKIPRPRKRNKESNKKSNMPGKSCNLSSKLKKFLGVPSMSRADAVKQLWSYVRDNNLQDPLDGQNIICDVTLRDLLGVDSINILQINKALAKHIRRSVKSVSKDKQVKEQREEDPDGPEMIKRQRKVLSGFLAPLPLSHTLMKFLGTGESTLTRADVIKRVWEYIKEKKLQDPFDRKTVICDEKLKELFNVDSFHGFTVSKLLTPHLVKP